MNLQCSFDPSATEHAFAVVEHRCLAWSHRQGGFFEPNYRLARRLGDNTSRKGGVTVANLDRHPKLFCLNAVYPVHLFGNQTASAKLVLSTDHDASALGVDVRDIPGLG